MPRKRQIDPGIWTSEQFMCLRPHARLLFIGMISLADDEGRLKGGALFLKSALFPSDHISMRKIEEWKQEIADHKLIVLYKKGDSAEEYIWLPTFTKHQYMTKRFPSKLPLPPQEVIDRLLTHTQQGDDRLHGDGGGDGIGIGVGIEVEDGVGKVPSPADKDTDLAVLIKTYEES